MISTHMRRRRPTLRQAASLGILLAAIGYLTFTFLSDYGFSAMRWRTVEQLTSSDNLAISAQFGTGINYGQTFKLMFPDTFAAIEFTGSDPKQRTSLFVSGTKVSLGDTILATSHELMLQMEKSDDSGTDSFPFEIKAHRLQVLDASEHLDIKQLPIAVRVHWVRGPTRGTWHAHLEGSKSGALPRISLVVPLRIPLVAPGRRSNASALHVTASMPYIFASTNAGHSPSWKGVRCVSDLLSSDRHDVEVTMSSDLMVYDVAIEGNGNWRIDLELNPPTTEDINGAGADTERDCLHTSLAAELEWWNQIDDLQTVLILD